MIVFVYVYDLEYIVEAAPSEHHKHIPPRNDDARRYCEPAFVCTIDESKRYK